MANAALKALISRPLRLIAGLCLVVGLATAAAAAARADGAGVLKVRLGGDARTTRVVIELDHEVKGRLLEVDAHTGGSKAPDPVALVLPRTAVAGDMSGAGAGLVREWAMDDVGGAARLRLTLARPAVVRRRFLLPPGDGLNVYRYVLDLEGTQAEEATVATPAAAPHAAPVRIEAPLEPLTPAKKVIVIDAGHGGKDPGAQGVAAHEKDLTLAAARSLRDQLKATGRYKVVLTRETDVFIPLEQRVKIARRANADLFISLHADAGTEEGLRGATVYTLSEKGADRSARSVFGHGPNWFDVDMPGRDPAVNRILLDLTQRETRNRSSEFAELVLDRIGERVTLLRRSHRDAGFMVLLAPDVPAVLLEMGFITNPADEGQLSDAGRRRHFMGGVTEAIDSYFAQEKRYAMR